MTEAKCRKEIIINDSNLRFYSVMSSVNNTTRILLQPPCHTISQIAHNLKIMSKVKRMWSNWSLI